MSEFVKKTIMGYKAVTNGRADPECTHVILTEEEYDGLLDKKDKAEEERYYIERSAKETIKKVKSEGKKALNDYKDETQKRIAAMEQALADEQAARVYQQQLNENLLRISRERANADRNLRPKKEHSGYVVISSTEKTYRYKKNKNWTVTTLWETVLQMPYSVDFTANQALEQMKADLFKRDTDQSWYPLLEKIGITAVCGKEYSEMIKDAQWRDAHIQHNVMLDWRLRADHRTGYWNVIFAHTKPLGIVPKEMRAN